MANTNTVRAILKREFPDAYYVGQVGWCGPQWEACAARERELKAPVVEFVSTETAYGRTVNHDFALKVF